MSKVKKTIIENGIAYTVTVDQEVIDHVENLNSDVWTEIQNGIRNERMNHENQSTQG